MSNRSTQATLEQALELQKRILVFDGHNDTPVERVHRGERPLTWMQEDPAYNMDIPRMLACGMDGGVFIVGNGPTANLWVTLELVLQQAEQHPQTIHIVRHSDDLVKAHASGAIAVLMGVEGAGRWLDGNLETAELLYRMGVRLLGITHGEGGPEAGQLQHEASVMAFCDASDRERARREGVGLTAFGREVLALSNRIGFLTDLAHINDKAFYQVLEASTLPITVSHTGVFNLCPHWRCLTDDQIRAVAAVGGVMGIAFSPVMLDRDNPAIYHVAQQVCYIADLVGIDHVAIGSDFDGLPRTGPVVPDVTRLADITRDLLNRGMSEEEIAKVWGGNFLRLLQKTIDR